MFENRIDAGKRLAGCLADRSLVADVVVAIPRGGLPVGRVVADRLDLPLDVVAARPIDVPGTVDLALGAVAGDGTCWLDHSLIDDLGIDREVVEHRVDREQETAAETVVQYRGDRPPLDLHGKTVLLVDDGVATRATTLTCLRRVRNAGAERIVLALPVAPPEAVERLRAHADEVLTVETPRSFSSVGRFYGSFGHVSDEQARACLAADER